MDAEIAAMMRDLGTERRDAMTSGVAAGVNDRSGSSRARYYKEDEVEILAGLGGGQSHRQQLNPFYGNVSQNYMEQGPVKTSNARSQPRTFENTPKKKNKTKTPPTPGHVAGSLNSYFQRQSPLMRRKKKGKQEVKASPSRAKFQYRICHPFTENNGKPTTNEAMVVQSRPQIPQTSKQNNKAEFKISKQQTQKPSGCPNKRHQNTTKTKKVELASDTEDGRENEEDSDSDGRVELNEVDQALLKGLEEIVKLNDALHDAAENDPKLLPGLTAQVLNKIEFLKEMNKKYSDKPLDLEPEKLPQEFYEDDDNSSKELKDNKEDLELLEEIYQEIFGKSDHGRQETTDLEDEIFDMGDPDAMDTRPDPKIRTWKLPTEKDFPSEWREFKKNYPDLYAKEMAGRRKMEPLLTEAFTYMPDHPAEETNIVDTLDVKEVITELRKGWKRPQVPEDYLKRAADAIESDDTNAVIDSFRKSMEEFSPGEEEISFYEEADDKSDRSDESEEFLISILDCIPRRDHPELTIEDRIVKVQRMINCGEVNLEDVQRSLLGSILNHEMTAMKYVRDGSNRQARLHLVTAGIYEFMLDELSPEYCTATGSESRNSTDKNGHNEEESAEHQAGRNRKSNEGSKRRDPSSKQPLKGQNSSSNDFTVPAASTHNTSAEEFGSPAIQFMELEDNALADKILKCAVVLGISVSPMTEAKEYGLWGEISPLDLNEGIDSVAGISMDDIPSLDIGAKRSFSSTSGKNGDTAATMDINEGVSLLDLDNVPSEGTNFGTKEDEYPPKDGRTDILKTIFIVRHTAYLFEGPAYAFEALYSVIYEYWEKMSESEDTSWKEKTTTNGP